MSFSNSLPEFDSLWNYDDPAATERAFRDLLLAAQARSDPGYHAELLSQIARSQGLQGRYDEAHHTLDDVEPLLERAGDRARVRYLLERGRVLNSSGRREEARPRFLEALDLARRAGEDFFAVDAAHMLAIVEPPEEGLTWNLRAIEMAEASEEPRARGWVGSLYNNLGWSYHALGHYQEALDTFQRGLEWQRQAGRDAQARIAAWTVGRALRSLGRYDEALRTQAKNLQAAEHTGHPDGYIHEELGENLLALGRAEAAQEQFSAAYRLLSRDPWLQQHEPARLERLAEQAGPQLKK